jgi:hypothetical protein
MNLNYYKQRIRPEHWEEFQQLIPEELRVFKKDDFISPGKQMSIEAAWEYAAEVIAEKYEYDETDEDEEDFC